MTWTQVGAIVYVLGWIGTVALVWWRRCDEDGYYLDESDGETLGRGLLLGVIWPLCMVLAPLALLLAWLIDRALDGGER